MKNYKKMFPKTGLPPFQLHFLTEDMLLFDIETTGLSPAKYQIYCIGCGYLGQENITVELFFARQPEDEPLLLEEFSRLLAKRSTVITFNGAAFDIPFFKKRWECLKAKFREPDTGTLARNGFHEPDETDFCPAHGFYKPNGKDLCPAHGFDEKVFIDLYREARRMDALLQLPSYKQKALEVFLGCFREDTYTGKELTHIYQDYLKNPDPEMQRLLILHNLEDVRGMFDLLGLLAYRQLPEGSFEIADILPETDAGRDYINIKLKLPLPVPQSIRRSTKYASILIDGDAALLRLPVHHGVLKRYFPDPENYYYLPEEDTAIHKSVGEFADPSHRQKATKKNCYAKKECDYILFPVPSEHPLSLLEPDAKKTCLVLPMQDGELLKELIQKFFRDYIK